MLLSAQGFTWEPTFKQNFSLPDKLISQEIPKLHPDPTWALLKYYLNVRKEQWYNSGTKVVGIHRAGKPSLLFQKEEKGDHGVPSPLQPRDGAVHKLRKQQSWEFVLNHNKLSRLGRKQYFRTIPPDFLRGEEAAGAHGCGEN